MSLFEEVKRAYFIATTENGYDLDSMTAEEVAIDMCSYDSEIEKYDVDKVAYTVKLYRGY